MNELIMPHNVGVKNALENMKEILALYKKVIGNYRPLLDGERYLTDKEVSQILKISRRTLWGHHYARRAEPSPEIYFTHRQARNKRLFLNMRNLLISLYTL